MKRTKKDTTAKKALRTSDSQVVKRGGRAVADFVQAITGLAASDRKDIIRDLSHLVQRGIQWKLASGLVDVYKDMQRRGKIKEDYENTDQCRQQSSYVFDAIKSDGAIDEKKFGAIKNLFLNSAQERLSDRNSLLPIVLMKKCSELEAGEIVVLETAFRLHNETIANGDTTPRYPAGDSHSWPSLIASESGLELPDLVIKYEESLMAKGLLNGRSPGGTIIADLNYHLSGTGLKLCEFIQDYEVSDSPTSGDVPKP